MTNLPLDIINMKTIAEAKALMNDRFPMMVKYFLEDMQIYLEEIEKGVQTKICRDGYFSSAYDKIFCQTTWR